MSWTHANQLLVKEHVGLFKAAGNYDIYDLSTGEMVLQCREPTLGFFTTLLRFTDFKRVTPFDVHVTNMDGSLVLRVTRGVAILFSNVRVHNENDEVLGGFKQKAFSIGGAFTVQDVNGQELCHLKGKWTGWDFQFLAQGVQLARVTKKWNGIGKEMFTTADNYVLDISDAVTPESPTRKLILAAVMCIDKVLKE